MRTRLTLQNRNGSGFDVEVHAPTGTTLLQLGSYLAAAADVDGGLVDGAVAPPGVTGGAATDSAGAATDSAGARESVVMWAGSRALPAAALIGGPGLRDGCIVGLGEPGPRDPVAHAVVCLQVVGGPDSGLVTALPRGQLSVGRDPECDVRLSDPAVSRRHLQLSVTATGINVRDLRSSNGTRLLGSDNSIGQSIDESGRELPLDRYLAVGETVLCVAAVGVPAAVTSLSETGRLLVNRPPRLGAVLPERVVAFPDLSSRSVGPSLPWLAALLPALGGAGLAWFMHNAQFLAFAILSPVMMLATGIGERVAGRRGKLRTRRDLRLREAEAEEELRAATATECLFRRHAHPDAAAVLHSAVTPDARIWERRRCDDDFLEVRLGLHDAPARVIVRRAAELCPAPLVAAVPLTTSLRLGPLGLCGPRPLVLGVARWVIAQVATLHSPADVRIVAFLSDEQAEDWTWLRWLPHAATETVDDGRGDSAGPALVARTALHRQVLMGALLTQIDDVSHIPGGSWSGPWTVVLIDRAAYLSDVAGLGRLLAHGHLGGVTAVCVDDDERRLPPACASVGRIIGELGTRVRLRVGSPGSRTEWAAADPGTTARDDAALADSVTPAWAERVARGLAPLTDPGDDHATAAIPTEVRLRDVLRLPDLDPCAILERWAAGDGAARTPIGVGADGVLDVDLGRDGPHALVAGTTGAGKSELLQSLVAGLALHAAPQDLQFVLIDYKGGAAFADCARLPHTAGLVTDLDAHLTERALLSLDAELRRREILFAHAAAVDLAAYRQTDLYRQDNIGRLVLVVDEFAALAEELPDFVAGLIGIAQRGRSLGIHLVLATQRPGSVVSPEIRANTALRISLRVTDPAESSDILGCDDAARIDKNTPGRAIVQTGSSRSAVQIGRVAGPAVDGSPNIEIVRVDGWGGRCNLATKPRDRGRTDLVVLVEALRTAAESTGAAPPRRPWLDPLPFCVNLDRFDDPGSTRLVLGLVDRPRAQRQDSFAIDLARGSSLLVAGGVRSGRTSTLRTAAVRACVQLSVEELHLYVIDCAGGGLRSLAGFPHCGAVVTRDAPATIDALLTRINREVADRHRHLAELGVGTLAEAATLNAGRPAVLLMIDGWEGFLAAVEHFDAGRSADVMTSLMREGSAAGLTIMLTGDRGSLSTRLSSAVQRRLILRLSDPADYAMAGLSRRSVPTSMPPGRGVDPADGCEVQLGVLGGDPSVAAQLDRVDQAVRHAAGSDTASDAGTGADVGVGVIRGGPAHTVHGSLTAPDGPRGTRFPPFMIRSLPARVGFSDIGGPVPAGYVALGVGGDDAGPVAVRVTSADRDTTGVRFLIAGPTRSGRSTALCLVAGQLAARADVEVVLAAAARSPLSVLARHLDLRVLEPMACTGNDIDESFTALLTSGRSTVLLVDDCELFVDTPSGDALAVLIRSNPPGLSVFAAGRNEDLSMAFRGVAAEVKRARTGLLLRPEPGDGDLLGVRLPFSRSSTPPGRGVLVADELMDRTRTHEDFTTGPLNIQIAQP